ncbi:MAG: DUF5916 domain-containing protein [Bacteroidota bacterium]|nr:DUF5916 domain-containing protein [Bacteroidota bacterium]
MKRILTSLSVILLLFSGATGQAPEKKRYKAEKITTAPVIDGILDDDAWKNQGTWIDDFTQFEPYNGGKVSQRTEFKILFDDDNLYAAFKAYDTSPDSIVQRLTRRDTPDGDLVGIILDSFHDLRTAFLFGITSSGVKYDQTFTNDGENEDSSWDPNWWVKTSINGEGWVAEMKIPFSQVRFDKNSGDIWGLEVARILFRKNETSFWQHIPKDSPGIVHMFGELSGLEQIKPRKIFDVTPYAVGKAETFKAEPGNPFREKGRKYGLNGGVDAKIGVTNNMTMDLTINPDFGQVEADPSEVNLSAYETFFKEKRPFFIEGNNITNFNMGIGDGDIGNDNLFYSRRIGRRPQGNANTEIGSVEIPTATSILGAAKLTGKTKDGLSLGFIEAVTAEEKAKIDLDGARSYETVEPMTNYLVSRVQKDYNEGRTIIGGIFTGTNRALNENLASTMHKSAYTGGIDFAQYTKNKSWMFSLNTAFSQVNGTKEAIEQTQMSSARYYQRPDKNYARLDPNRTSLFGNAGRMMISKNNGHIHLMGVVIWKTPGFETNDLGYMQSADQIISVAWIGYNQWEPKGIYRNYNLNCDVVGVFDFGGNSLLKIFEYNGNINLKNYWSAWGGGNIGLNALDGTMLRGGPMMRTPGFMNIRGGFSSDNRKKFGVNFFTNYNQGFEKYYHNSYSELDISYKPTNYLSFTLGPSYNKSYTDLQYVTNLTFNNTDRYIFASIDRNTVSASLRINYNLNPELTLQYWGQPFVASGRYYDHKYILDPMADKYTSRFHTYTPDQITSRADEYGIDENMDGGEDYTIGKMDFNYKAFLSNLVIRWEYSPGSSIYLVWSQTRDGSNPTGNMDYINDLGDLFDRRLYKHDDNYHLNNVFLIKFSYRFGLK